MGNTMLYYAVSGNHFDLAKHLISLGADVNEKNQRGDTALHCASWKNNFKMSQLLIQSNSSKELMNDEGLIPFELARSNEIKSLLYIITNDDNLLEDYDFIDDDGDSD